MAGPVTLPGSLVAAYGPSKRLRILRRTGLLLLLIVLASWQAEVDIIEFIRDLPNAIREAAPFLTPDLSALPGLVQPALVTIFLALIPTPIGIAIAVPLAIAASKNLAPPPVRLAARTLITLARGLPEFVLMLLLASAFGLGAFPGIVAIVVGTIGMLGKLVADAAEDIDMNALESLECLGGRHSQLIRYGVLPQVMPTIIANSLFRFEQNLQQAGLLGAVGAGGLGWELTEAIMTLEYPRASAVVIVTLAVIFLGEKFSDWLRKHLVEGDVLK